MPPSWKRSFWADESFFGSFFAKKEQRKMFCNTEHPRSRQIAECSFLSDQKGTEKVAATSEARGTAERVEAALPQHRFLLPQRAASASLVLARHPVLRRPRSLPLPLCGEGLGTFAAWFPPWGYTPPRPPKGKSNRKNLEKCLDRLFFHRFFRFSTVNSGVPEPPWRKNCGWYGL